MSGARRNYLAPTHFAAECARNRLRIQRRHFIEPLERNGVVKILGNRWLGEAICRVHGPGDNLEFWLVDSAEGFVLVGCNTQPNNRHSSVQVAPSKGA